MHVYTGRYTYVCTIFLVIEKEREREREKQHKAQHMHTGVPQDLEQEKINKVSDQCCGCCCWLLVYFCVCVCVGGREVGGGARETYSFEYKSPQFLYELVTSSHLFVIFGISRTHMYYYEFFFTTQLPNPAHTISIPFKSLLRFFFLLLLL